MSGTHEMIMVGVSDSGTEEWLCPRCGRRTLLRRGPDHEKVVLDVGDALAVHFGGRERIRTGVAEIVPDVRECDVEWLRGLGIDWHGQKR
ncbi:hypothetical protein [Nonomuraea rhizosphaerae]|uniref:hypothetical protein n=1 Tax=Nonomuraea rhizosphaerae TaxID=2665663 RepID=UPI001C60470B|nr:hypothetical protein [Nonomuraea rhizosphaerae]